MRLYIVAVIQMRRQWEDGMLEGCMAEGGSVLRIRLEMNQYRTFGADCEAARIAGCPSCGFMGAPLMMASYCVYVLVHIRAVTSCRFIWPPTGQISHDPGRPSIPHGCRVLLKSTTAIFAFALRTGLTGFRIHILPLFVGRNMFASPDENIRQATI